MGESEEVLLAKAVGGDDGALSALLESHGPQIRRQLAIARPYQSLIDADDVMQVTYIEAFLQIDRFRPKGPDSLSSWLRQIARNNLRDAIKALRSEKRLPPSRRIELAQGDDSSSGLYELFGATISTPSRRAARDEIKALLESAITKLPPDYATAVRLFDLEGRSGPEVASAMGRSRGAVHMLRARAHDRLREDLGSASRFFSQGT